MRKCELEFTNKNTNIINIIDLAEDNQRISLIKLFRKIFQNIKIKQ